MPKNWTRYQGTLAKNNQDTNYKKHAKEYKAAIDDANKSCQLSLNDALIKRAGSNTTSKR
ncbi:hypothetical protein P7H06_25540 [Paenibacillus larvae]|nr:hypothetical protein [Paenibacillus larvae]MDT2262181.1 hypothetical protein [Paenibacillus larvae]